LNLGLIFYVYFYYWTAAGLALLIALAVDVGYRRVYFHIGWIGGLIGLPMVVSDFLLRKSEPSVTDWLHRCNRFLTIGRFDGMESHKDILIILSLGLAWVLWRQRDLIFVWALGAAGLLLEHHQVLTRLQLENYHWVYVWGPAFSFLTAVSVAAEIGNRLNWTRRICAAFAVVGVTALGVGLWIRSVEATGSDTVKTLGEITAYRAEFPSGRLPGFAPNTVVAGDADFVDFSSILHDLRPLAGWSAYNSPSLTTRDLNDREALNELLLGLNRVEFETKQPHELLKYRIGPWFLDRSLVPGLVADRLAAYDRAQADLSSALDRFAVVYVGLRIGRRPDYLATGWTLLANGPVWEVWKRESATGK
jgi:hypothetical protein